MKFLLTTFWHQLLFGSEDFTFIADVILRTLIMFTVIVVGLRFLGKRGVKQLSVFELVVIIGLGSAAGDPMFYKEVGIIFSIAVFIVVIGLYAGITYFIGKSKKFEDFLEGKSICLITNGVFNIKNFNKENLGSDEFFSELRLKGVSQLGQIETAILETSGDVSIFFLSDADTKYGLPTLLNPFEKTLQYIQEDGYYACTFCGNTEEKPIGNAGSCTECGKHKWVQASNKRRIT